MSSNQSNMFDQNFMMLKIFGIWPGNTAWKYYRYYSFIYLFFTFASYNLLLTVSLLYTPRKIELLLPEVMFYFTEISITMKMMTILLKRDKLIEAMKLIDCDEFEGDIDDKDGILSKANMTYNRGWKLYTFTSNIAFSSLVFLPFFLVLIRGTKSEFPICKYYFLSDEDREAYFFFWYIYQAVGMYGHVMYSVNIDALIAGLLIIAIAQLKLLNKKFYKLKLSEVESELSKEIQEQIQISRLNQLLRHYEVILEYCNTVQNISSTTLFFQFGVASIKICVVMGGLLLPSETDLVFLVIYFITVTLQIFVPGYLGTQLTYESQELLTAAYNSDWITRSESFKKSLRLFRERATIPIVISGLKMFPLSLNTFTAIVKTAYSFFTLIKNVQEQ
uniref:Odorant receptor n=1 Tax=Athetis lepigone TaxID=1223490 RepID=A0A1B3B747_ATHLE|nr:putative odorant receptor OR35 [Athetis lepigone]